MAGGKTFGAILSIGYLAIATRTLGIDRFGKFALALGMGQAIAALVAFQSWHIVVRYGMPHLVERRRDALARLLNFTFRLDLTSAFVGAVLVCLVMPLLALHFAWSDSFTWQATAMGVVLVLSTQWTPIGILRLHDRYATAALADSVTPATRFVGAIVAWQLHATPLAFMAVWALAEALTAAAYWFSALRVSKGTWALPERLRWRDVAADNPGIRNYAITTNLNSSLELGGKQVAVLIVGLLVTPAAAGGYRLVQQLAQAMAKLSQMMTRAIFPEMMRSRSHSEGEQFQDLFAGIWKVTASGALAVFVLLLVAGKFLLGLIAGPEYLPAYPILLVLGTAAAIDFAAVGFEPALVALGRPGLALKLRAGVTVLLLASMPVLTLGFGGIGAGFAVLGASVVSFALLWFNARRVMRASGH
jgi:O-antigen/teichoic acid export membrane protein